MPGPLRQLAAWTIRERFTILTIVLFGYIFVLAPAPQRSQLWGHITQGVLSAVVIISLCACVRRRRVMVPLTGIGVVVLALIWVAEARPGDGELVLANYLGTATVLLLTAVIVLNDVASTPRVTHDTVLGAISAYLLFALVFALIYAAEYTLNPSSFDIPDAVVTVLAESNSNAAVTRVFMYFSFVTISTLGYGDVLPSSTVAQATAAGEAILGQVFLAVAVARLVALQIAHASNSETDVSGAESDE